MLTKKAEGQILTTENLQLQDLLCVDPETKILSCLGQRVIIADAISRGLLKRELIQVFGTYGARNVLTRYGYAHGWRTAEILKHKIPKLFHATNGGAYLHMLFGLVFTTTITESDGDGEEPLIYAKLEHSYEAEQHLIHFGKSHEAICWTLTGFASGYESFKRKRDVYFIEKKCIGMGDEFCEIEGRYADKWGDVLRDQLPFYGMDSTNDILAELSRQIHTTEKKLAKTKHRLDTLESRANSFQNMVIRSKPMQEIIKLAERIAKRSPPVVITGESGVGKEVLARYIHTCNSEKMQPFIAVNCGAFSEELLESELFGHAKGAFTGAEREHRGLFEEAEGGTLFLDEIAETSPKMQVKLLRVLQEKEIRRVGENTPRKINVRIISATNKDLEGEIERGNFRQDLYFRLKVIELKIPALRERTADILPLAHNFLQQAKDEMNLRVTGFASEASSALLKYDWPGNIRELQNAVYRAASLCDSKKIEISDLPPELITNQSGSDNDDQIKSMQSIEQSSIRHALAITGGNKKMASEKLGISMATLYRKIKTYGITVG